MNLGVETGSWQAPVEEEVFENERYIPIRGWSSRNLTPLDRRRFSRGRDQAIGDSTTEFPKVPLPAGESHPAYPYHGIPTCWY